MDGDRADQDDRRPFRRCRSGEDRPRDAAHEQGKQDRRKAQDHIGDPHDQRIDPAAEIPGEKAESDTKGCREQDRAAADGDGHARAVEHRRKQVAALVVGAEDEARVAVCREGGRELGIDQLEGGKVGRIVGRDPGGQQRAGDEGQGEDRGDDHRDRSAQTDEQAGSGSERFHADLARRRGSTTA